MQNRRGFLLTVVTGIVAMAFVVGTVIADELIGVLTKVDLEGKEITVVEKDSDKEVKIKVTDDTQQVAKKKGEETITKLDLEKLDGFLKKVQEKGKKGLSVVVTHENRVASKLQLKGMRKKKAE